VTQYERDGELGAAALDLAKHGSNEIAQLLKYAQYFHESYPRPGSYAAGGLPGPVFYRGLLLFPVDVIDEWKDAYTEPTLVALRRAAEHASRSLQSLRVAPLPEAAGWRERLNAVGDWGGAANPDWWAISERLDELKEAFRRSVTAEDRKDVGRRARDLVIATVLKVYRPSMVKMGQEPPKAADAKAMFDVILESRAGGSRHSDLRKLLRAAFDAGNTLTHSGDARAVDTFAVAQATVLIVRTLARLDEELNR
jgi:hypothetical protein